MPEFLHPRDKDLNEMKYINKRVVKMLRKGNKGNVIGVTEKNAEGFNNLVNMFESVETLMEVFLYNINLLIPNPITIQRVKPLVPEKLFIELKKIPILLKKVDYMGLTAPDIETIRNYSVSFQQYSDSYHDSGLLLTNELQNLFDRGEIEILPEQIVKQVELVDDQLKKIISMLTNILLIRESGQVPVTKFNQILPTYLEPNYDGKSYNPSYSSSSISTGSGFQRYMTKYIF